MILLGQDIQTWHTWVNSGALATFAVFVCWGVYRLIMLGGKKALGLGERYVTSTEALHATLKESENNRNKLCESHASGLRDMSGVLVESNAYLAHLVKLHEEPGNAIADAVEALALDHQDVQRFKKAALQACRMCREISRRELPDSADEVSRHCDEIERLIIEQ